MLLFCIFASVVDVGTVVDKDMIVLGERGGRRIAEEVDIYRKFTNSRLHWLLVHSSCRMFLGMCLNFKQ